MRKRMGMVGAKARKAATVPGEELLVEEGGQEPWEVTERPLRSLKLVSSRRRKTGKKVSRALE